jgi:hypothetical protein
MFYNKLCEAIVSLFNTILLIKVYNLNNNMTFLQISQSHHLRIVYLNAQLIRRCR